MIHQTTVSRRRDDQDRPYWWARCTCARWEVATGTRAHAEAKARAHERSAW